MKKEKSINLKVVSAIAAVAIACGSWGTCAYKVYQNEKIDNYLEDNGGLEHIAYAYIIQVKKTKNPAYTTEISIAELINGKNSGGIIRE